MTPVLLGQILGVAFACGLNLYATVAALGILSRFGFIHVPAGLHGLEGFIVIISALVLYVIEAVVDRIPHLDSVWDTVHTFIRPPAAALLAVGALWGHPASTLIAGALLALLAALAAHATKAGVRLTLHTQRRGQRHRWISTFEDALAVVVAVAGFRFPIPSSAAIGVLLVALLLVGARFWRAFGLGMRALIAWVRSLFTPARWREVHDLPRDFRALLDPVPLGAAPPKAARAAVHGLAGAGAYRNGWLVLTAAGPVFLYRTLLGSRRVDLPVPDSVENEDGVWAHTLDIHGDGAAYTLYLLRDGPPLELAIQNLSHGTA